MNTPATATSQSQAPEDLRSTEDAYETPEPDRPNESEYRRFDPSRLVIEAARNQAIAMLYARPRRQESA